MLNFSTERKKSFAFKVNAKSYTLLTVQKWRFKINSNPQFLMRLFHPPPSSRLHEWTSWIQILNHFEFSRVLTRSKNVRHALHSFCVELGMVSIIAAQLSHMEFQTFLWLLRKPTSMKKHHNFDVRRPYFLILKK